MPFKDKNRARECHQAWRKANLDKVKELNKAEVARLKNEVLSYYGNGKLACVKCGFSDIRALSIDHINGDGSKDGGWKNRRGGQGFYRLLRRQGLPEGYQTLCMNCQFIKRVEGKEEN